MKQIVRSTNRATSHFGLGLLAGALLYGAPLAAQDAPSGFGTPWGRVQVKPGSPVDTRPFPPKAGRRRCIGVDTIAGAQMFGDSAIELSMKNGNRFRLFFARECPALSFYQGFYYKRGKAGQLCAGRDVVGSRAGGECPIASILPVRDFKSPASKSGRAKRRVRNRR